MQVLLQVEGFDVALATDGQSGITAAEVDAPDLVIVDMFMPGMNGRDTIRALRQRVPQVPIIAASGVMAGPLPGTTDASGDLGSVGADLSLPKPFRPRQLLDAVRQLLHLS